MISSIDAHSSSHPTILTSVLLSSRQNPSTLEVKNAANIINLVKKASSETNDCLAIETRSIHFKTDPESNKLIIEVLDRTRQLIRRIPDVEIYCMISQMGLTTGVFLEEKN